MLSPAMEDYIKAIWTMIKQNKIVRVKDLAEYLNVSTPSVVGSIKQLKKEGFIIHEPYGYIDITQKGINIALEIEKRHNILYRFFNNILQLDKHIADEDACKIEHHINPFTLQQLEAFLLIIENCGQKEMIMDKLKLYNKHKKLPEDCSEEYIPLSKTQIGDKVIVEKISSPPYIKKRLIDMGVIPGSELEFINIAPLGDPIEIKVKGMNISLRKEEAEGIIVRRTH